MMEQYFPLYFNSIYYHFLIEERVLQDIIRPNMEMRKEFSNEEVDAINQGGQTIIWKKIKKIKIVKEENDD